MTTEAKVGAFVLGSAAILAFTIIHLVNAHGTKIEGHRKARPDVAVKEAENLRATLRENANPYLRVLGDRYGALALLADNRPQAAVDLLSETIAYARAQNAGLELEPYLLTILTEALIAVGSPSAPAMAAEAVHLARKRAMRIAEQEASALQRKLEPSGDAETA